MILDTLRDRARIAHRTIVLPESDDERVLKAARRMADEALCNPVLVGVPSTIEQQAVQLNIALDGIQIVDGTEEHSRTACAAWIEGRRRAKGMTMDEAHQAATDPLMMAGWLVATGAADAAVAGSLATTARVIRAGLYTIGLKPTSSVVSSYFIMDWPDSTYFFADCGVVPVPTDEQLCDIAASTAQNFERIMQKEARVAFLSFSTKGSADHESLVPIRQAAHFFKQRHPSIQSDGELQGDAALVATVRATKAPQSTLRENANVLIFPDLNAGNIAYKLCERLGGASAMGPIIQGLARPYVDLSRGCSVEDIVNVACIAALSCE